MSDDYQRALGERLRSIRAQQGLTLQEVEERSGGTWKAVVVGSYERGDRAVSIAKLAQLARFYGVPLADLLPRTPADEPEGEQDRPPRLVLDLNRLDEVQASARDDQLRTLRSYADRIALQRGDYNGRVLTLRVDDLHTLAVVFDSDPDQLTDRLAEQGLLAER